MLSKIFIKNYILIDELELDLAPGLNIITGETGAGKSILINAIDIAFGAKAGREVIKTGADKALIEITILNKKQNLAPLFEEYGIDDTGEELILSREIIINFAIRCCYKSNSFSALTSSWFLFWALFKKRLFRSCSSKSIYTFISKISCTFL